MGDESVTSPNSGAESTIPDEILTCHAKLPKSDYGRIYNSIEINDNEVVLPAADETRFSYDNGRHLSCMRQLGGPEDPDRFRMSREFIYGSSDPVDFVEFSFAASLQMPFVQNPVEVSRQGAEPIIKMGEGIYVGYIVLPKEVPIKSVTVTKKKLIVKAKGYDGLVMDLLPPDAVFNGELAIELIRIEVEDGLLKGTVRTSGRVHPEDLDEVVDIHVQKAQKSEASVSTDVYVGTGVGYGSTDVQGTRYGSLGGLDFDFRAGVYQDFERLVGPFGIRLEAQGVLGTVHQSSSQQDNSKFQDWYVQESVIPALLIGPLSFGGQLGLSQHMPFGGDSSVVIGSEHVAMNDPKFSSHYFYGGQVFYDMPIMHDTVRIGLGFKRSQRGDVIGTLRDYDFDSISENLFRNDYEFVITKSFLSKRSKKPAPVSDVVADWIADQEPVPAEPERVPIEITNASIEIKPGQQQIRFPYSGPKENLVGCRVGGSGDELACTTDDEGHIVIELDSPITRPDEYRFEIQTADVAIPVTAVLKAPRPQPAPKPQIDLSEEE